MSVTSSRELEINPSMENVIEELCRKVGLTPEMAYGVLAEGIQAQYPMMDRYGEVSYHKDHPTRHKYLLTYLELVKHLKDKQVIAQLGVFNDPNIEQDAKRILALRDKK